MDHQDLMNSSGENVASAMANMAINDGPQADMKNGTAMHTGPGGNQGKEETEGSKPEVTSREPKTEGAEPKTVSPQEDVVSGMAGQGAAGAAGADKNAKTPSTSTPAKAKLTSSIKRGSSIPVSPLKHTSVSPSAGSINYRQHTLGTKEPRANAGDAKTKTPGAKPQGVGAKIPADSPKTPDRSGCSSPATPKSPASRASTPGQQVKKVAVVRTPPKSPGSLRSRTALGPVAPMPDLKNIKSKIGSTENLKHQPGGGKVQIVHKKIDVSNVQSKCGSKANIHHKPGGGNVEIKSEKLDFKAQSKIGSLDNIGHVAGGGQRKREKGKEAEGATGASVHPNGDERFGLPQCGEVSLVKLNDSN